MATQAQGQGDGAAHDEPDVERRNCTTGVVERPELDLVDQLAGPDDGAAHGVAVTVEVFGQRVDDEVRAPLQGPHERRRGERGVGG